MSDQSASDRLTKTMRVAEALNHVGLDPIVVGLDMEVREVAMAAAGHPAVRVISVVDANGRLAGLIRVGLLCDDLLLSIAPEEFIADILEPGKLDEFRRLAHATVAADLMEPAEGVQEDDTLGAAFHRLHERNLDGLAVLDAEGRPVAYLDRLRLIAVWLEAHPRPGSA